MTTLKQEIEKINKDTEEIKNIGDELTDLMNNLKV